MIDTNQCRVEKETIAQWKVDWLRGLARAIERRTYKSRIESPTFSHRLGLDQNVSMFLTAQPNPARPETSERMVLG